MPDDIERFLEYLAERGQKYTRQRQAIAEVFFGQDVAHRSLDELLELARAKHGGLGYATVYRTMRLFVEGGFAIEHKFSEGVVRYEPRHEDEHHDHLICTRCGKIVEYHDDDIERLQEEIARRHGFRVTGHRHEIYGECLEVCTPGPTGTTEVADPGHGH